MIYVKRLFPCAAVDLREMLQDIIQPVDSTNCDYFIPFQMLYQKMENDKKMYFFMWAI